MASEPFSISSLPVRMPLISALDRGELGHDLTILLHLAFGRDGGVLQIPPDRRDLPLNFVDHVLDTFGMIGAIAGKRADIGGYQRKAAARLAGPAPPRPSR